MDDAELLNRLMVGSDDSDGEKHEQELMDRARAGNQLCRPLAYRLLWTAWHREIMCRFSSTMTRLEAGCSATARRGAAGEARLFGR